VLATKVGGLPAQLRRSLTWDQDVEMVNHVRFTRETGISVYFAEAPLSLAARLQREHQRAAPAVHPKVWVDRHGE
jgi:IS30 family transposase